MELGWDGARAMIFGDPESLSKSPELFHYTNFHGLQGILKSQSIRATHYADLNDTTEISYVRLFLMDAIIESIRKIVAKHAILRLPKRHRLRLPKDVESVSKELGQYFVDFMYGHLSAESDDGAYFLSSFCSHKAGSYENESGLLSQWRGYGVGGGYCLVFDTKKLYDLLTKEYASSAYFLMSITTVEYADPDFRATSFWRDLSQRLDIYAERVARGELAIPEEALQFFIARVAGLKHRAFREESEIRIVARPTARSIRNALARTPGITPPPSKRVQMVETARGRRRFISLFDGLGQTLPITRVIVGPSIDQSLRLGEARSLCGADVEVTASSTPFVG